MKYMGYVICFILEISLIIIHIPIELCKLFINLDSLSSSPNTDNPTVILVERWFRRNILHVIFKKYLEKHGFRVFSINTSLFYGDFDLAAKKLDDLIEKNQLEKIVLVGISGGGVTCLQYLQFHEGWKKVVLFISLAAPLKGTWLAKFGPPFKSIKEMIPDSVFMRKLHGDKLLHPEKIVTISAKYDEMVPCRYNFLEGVRNITFDIFGHNLIHTIYIPTFVHTVGLIKSLVK